MGSVMKGPAPSTAAARRLPVPHPVPAESETQKEEFIKHRIAETSAEMSALASELARLLALSTGSAAYKDLARIVADGSSHAAPQASQPGQAAAIPAVGSHRPLPGLEDFAPPSLAKRVSERLIDNEERASMRAGCDSEWSSEVAMVSPPPTPPELEDPTPMTTLMIRNVPVMYTQAELVEEWSNDGTYDFLYLPRAGNTNLSYAFVNFTSTAAAEAFQARWQKQRLGKYISQKPLNISFAEVQGLEANLWALRKKRISRLQARKCEPIILIGGRQVPYAEAVAKLASGGER